MSVAPVSAVVSTPTAVTEIPSAIPLRRDPPASGESSSSLPLLISLPVVLLCLAVFFAYRRYRRSISDKTENDLKLGVELFRPWAKWFKPNVGAGVKLLGSTRLTQNHSLHVLQWKGREILIGCAGASMVVVATHPITPQSEVQGSGAQ